MEMSETLRRRWLMSEHVAGVDPGHTDTRSSCVRDRWSTSAPSFTLSLHLPRRGGGKLIVSVIDCRGRSVLSSG